MNKVEIIEKCEQYATLIRKKILTASYNSGKKGVHIGSALSLSDILAVLYGGILNYDCNNPVWNERDRFILSKGHAYVGLYSILNITGYFSDEEFKDNFMMDGGFLPAHPVKNLSKGIECSSGSLGMGLSFAVGKAYYAKLEKLKYRTYVILGDGECNEGSVWEAFMAAAQFKLSNLIAIIDHNKWQQDGHTDEVMNIDFERVLTALGWDVAVVDGHNIEQLFITINKRNEQVSDKPFAIVANTIKGKGVQFMEDDNKWHHAHLTEEQYYEALNSLKSEEII